MPLTRSKAFSDTSPSELLGLHGANNGFVDDINQYFAVLLRTPQNFIARAIHVHKLEDTVQNLHASRKGEVVKTLNWCARAFCIGRSAWAGVSGGAVSHPSLSHVNKCPSGAF